ncbi:MAG: phosphopantothenoylcysteine decarboxylase [PVC group bacterium]|nr:phosphopantothenoylcysteine decarboxylase [PVC group bacterium]
MKKKQSSFNILITAGPTREYLDPVRFISNPSTGKIGYLLASAAKKKGHKVVLLSGPTYLKPPQGVKVLSFNTALELKKLAKQHFAWADCVICASAVSDYRPLKTSKQKIKKAGKTKTIVFSKNPDILQELGRMKKNQVLVGFALETRDLIKNAEKKLKEKNLDFIVANMLSREFDPFGEGRTSAVILSEKDIEKLQHIKKEQLARIILDRVFNLCYSLLGKKRR